MSDPRKMRKTIIIALVLLSLLIAVGCGGGDPAVPNIGLDGLSDSTAQNEEQNRNRVEWGYWDIAIDTESMTSQVIPLRAGQVHYNVLQMLEGWSCTDCVFIDKLSWSGKGTLLIDIGIRHPYPSNRLDLTGRDVRGVAIFDATQSFPNHRVRDKWGNEKPLLASMRVLNADGYTTHFNRETAFTGNGLFNYRPGRMTFPSESQIVGNLHPFRNFYTDEYKRLFRPNHTVIKTYEIDVKFQTVFRFGYSVDASWNYPLHWPVKNPITDFDISTSAREAFQISMTVDSNELTRQMGNAKLTFDVFDHQGIDSISVMSLEAPDLFAGKMNLDPTGWIFSDKEMARYTVTIDNKLGYAGIDDGFSEVLIVVEDSGMSIVGEDVRAYDIWRLPVKDVPMAWRPRGGSFLSRPFYGPKPAGPTYDFTVISDPQAPWAIKAHEPMLVFLDNSTERYIAWNRDFNQYQLLAGYPSSPGSWLVPAQRIDAASTGAFGVLSKSETVVSGSYLVKHCTNMHLNGGIYNISWHTNSLSDPSPHLQIARDVSGGFGNAVGDPVYSIYLFEAGTEIGPQPSYVSLHRIGSPYNDPMQVLRAYLPMTADLSGSLGVPGISYKFFSAMGVDDEIVGETSPYIVDIYTAENRLGGSNVHDKEVDVYKVNFSAPDSIQHVRTYENSLLGQSIPSPGISLRLVDIAVLPAGARNIDMGLGKIAQHNWFATLYQLGSTQWIIEIYDAYGIEPDNASSWKKAIYVLGPYKGIAYAMDVDPENFEIYVLHKDGAAGIGDIRLTCFEYY